MPNILIESMGSGLPIACSEKMPMPEFLEEGGIYFNATLIESIERSLINLLSNLPLLEKRKNNLNKLKEFSWRNTSKKTFSFISNIKS
jgi:glycosyltransferase involved in cell wall biosynthesis